MKKGVIPDPFKLGHRGFLTCAEENLIQAFCRYQSEIAKVLNADHILSQYLALIKFYQTRNAEALAKAFDDVLIHICLPVSSGYIDVPSIPAIENMEEHTRWLCDQLEKIAGADYIYQRLAESFVTYQSEISAFKKMENDFIASQQLALTRFLFLLEPDAVYKSITHFTLCPIQSK